VEANRLLLIEEDRAARDALQEVFVSRNWEVVMVTTQSEALRLLCDYVPHWVILSWEQVEGTGDRFMRAVRTQSREARVALLMGSMDAAGHRIVSRLKPDLRIRKPYHPEDVFLACEPSWTPKAALG
jgi:DNA-binding response OmpR family regulator